MQSNLSNGCFIARALPATYQADNLATPANWHPGDDYIVPVLNSEQKEELGQDHSDYYQVDWFLTFVKN